MRTINVFREWATISKSKPLVQSVGGIECFMGSQRFLRKIMMCYKDGMKRTKLLLAVTCFIVVVSCATLALHSRLTAERLYIWSNA
jgi:hypothetical protein